MNETKTNKKKHLGRGLQALLGPITSGPGNTGQAIPIATTTANALPQQDLQSVLREIPIDSIRPNPYQPRKNWDQQQLQELADSIKTSGLLQPILVRRDGQEYELIAGERRLNAAELAGLTTIPAIVRTASDQQLLELALIENIHRADLNPMERAQAYQDYISTFSFTQAEAAQRLGQDRSVIANHLRLLQLPAEIRQMLIDGTLSMGHARALLAVADDSLRTRLANRAMAGRLSVRDVERLVRHYTTGDRQAAIRSKPAHIQDLEAKLTGELGTRVTIETRRGGQRGRIVIEFYSLDDFDRITERLGLAPAEQL